MEGGSDRVPVSHLISLKSVKHFFSANESLQAETQNKHIKYFSIFGGGLGLAGWDLERFELFLPSVKSKFF